MVIFCIVICILFLSYASSFTSYASSVLSYAPYMYKQAIPESKSVVCIDLYIVCITVSTVCTVCCVVCIDFSAVCIVLWIVCTILVQSRITKNNRMLRLLSYDKLHTVTVCSRMTIRSVVRGVRLLVHSYYDRMRLQSYASTIVWDTYGIRMTFARTSYGAYDISVPYDRYFY